MNNAKTSAARHGIDFDEKIVTSKLPHMTQFATLYD